MWAVYTGAENIENAVTWLVEHEDDADIDEMPLVKFCRLGSFIQFVVSFQLR
jgi:hypothetical protein